MGTARERERAKGEGLLRVSSEANLEPIAKILKIGVSPFQKKIICFNGSTLKEIKNVFNFILKSIFVLKIFKFLR